jgi:hypothetical protein
MCITKREQFTSDWRGHLFVSELESDNATNGLLISSYKDDLSPLKSTVSRSLNIYGMYWLTGLYEDWWSRGNITCHLLAWSTLLSSVKVPPIRPEIITIKPYAKGDKKLICYKKRRRRQSHAFYFLSKLTHRRHCIYYCSCWADSYTFSQNVISLTDYFYWDLFISPKPQI